MRKRVLIVGSGITGITAARVLAEQDIEVLLIEQGNRIGGACQDFYDASGVNVHRFGPHIFRTNRKDIIDYLQRFSEFYTYQHKVLSYVNGQYLPFPINLNTLKMLYADDWQEKMDILSHQNRNNIIPSNFEEAMIQKIGEDLYELFYKGYSRKQWLIDPNQLSPEVASIIPIRMNSDDRYFTDAYQGIPIRGYSEMFFSMLDHPNIHIVLNTNYFDVQNEFLNYSIIYTGRVDQLLDYRYGKLEYHSVKFEYRRGTKKESLPAAVINYPNDYDFIRETEYNAFSPYEFQYPILGREYPQKDGYPFYSVPTEENLALARRYLSEVKSTLPNIIPIGRIATYKNQNMAQCVASAMDVINRCSL